MSRRDRRPAQARARRTVAAFAGFALAALLGQPAAARTCAEVDADARQAHTAGDLETLIGFYREAHDPASACDPLFLADFGRDVALAHVDRFAALVAADGDAAAHKQVLEQARAYGEPWQLLLTLAEVEHEAANHDLAAAYYQQAVRGLETSSRSVDTGSAAASNLPTEDEFRMIYGKMAEAALLAHTFSPPAASRGEETGGLFAESYRGYVVAAVPVPVQFHFDSTRFTEKGVQVAQYLLQYLIGGGIPAIKLVGHTDPIGSDAYNYDLSLRRAAALRDYLYQGGYAGAVDIEGRGESEPFQPIDPERFLYDIEAKHQLDRRVELVRYP
jgi:outer membrane protein OmpA-like peptidoglycan-associated protein